MPVQEANEVVASIIAYARANAELIALVATDAQTSGPAIFSGDPQSGGSGFPKVIFEDSLRGLRGTDTEGWLGGRDISPISCFGSDLPALWALARKISEVLNEAYVGGTLDTEHYRVTILRQAGPWRKLKWQQKAQSTGNELFQLTSDWLLVYGKKQGA